MLVCVEMLAVTAGHELLLLTTTTEADWLLFIADDMLKLGDGLSIGGFRLAEDPRMGRAIRCAIGANVAGGL